jgi:type IV secretion system protein TrbJ
MKTRLLLIVSLFAATHCWAQWAVFDGANLRQSLTNYAAMVEQLSRQAQQISNQVRQIGQMDDQLARLGNMADIKAVVGFPEFRVNLTLPTKLQTWADGLPRIDGYGLFGDSRGGIYVDISAEFPDFDGVAIPRVPDVYKPEHEITAKVDNFKEVQADVYARREALKRAIATTSEALQAATTDAEEQKLEAVLNAQYDQLAALDSEVVLSAAEIQVKEAESAAMQGALDKAEAEARARLVQEEAKKVRETFKPIYESILLYVKEQPLSF